MGGVRQLPLDHPGTADTRTPGGVPLVDGAAASGTPSLGGMFFGIVWMSAQAVMPAVIGRAIDDGVADRDGGELLEWAAVMFGIGLVQAVAGIVRHRFAVTNWLTAAYRTVQLVSRQTVHLGGTLPRKVSTGEVVAIGTNDLSHIGQVMDVSARFAGAIVSFLLVSVILLNTSVTLGLVVLIGVPLLMLVVGPLLGPLQARSATQRHLMGDLSNTASDIVGGLRVLRGIGGEQVFHDRYRRESQTVRTAGVQVAKLQSLLDALQIFLPGVFVVVVVWLGARYAVEGRITPRRAGRVLRLLRVPDDPAAHRDRVRQQGHPRPRLGGPGRAACSRSTPDVTDPPRSRPSPPAGVRPDRRTHRARGARRPADRDRQRAARRLRRARRPARHVPPAGRRRRPARRRTPHLAAPLRGPRARSSSPTPAPCCSPAASATASTSPAARRRRGAPSTPPRPTTSSRRSPTASTRSSPSAAAPSPAASASGWCWRAP